MARSIRKCAVIGAGVMGATIAAQLANVGIETLLLDIVLPELSDEDKKGGLAKRVRGLEINWLKKVWKAL